MSYEVTIITTGTDLPDGMTDGSFFHSVGLFKALETTPGQKPYMVVAYCGGRIVGHMLVTLRRRGALIPPCLFTQARIYGEGVYAPDCDKETVFGLMLKAVADRLHRGMCLYIELSDLSAKMFGYSKLRENGFFPVHWMEVHNSLHHDTNLRERLTFKMRKHLARAKRSELVVTEAETEAECNDFFKMMRGGITFKLRRFIPDIRLFMQLKSAGGCRLFLARDDGKPAAGCLCAYSGSDCYVWYLATRRKLHRRRAAAIAVWTAILRAAADGYRHVCFMDAGLPYKKNPFREFILGFGGKPVGTFRWFRFSPAWLNRLLSWIYRG